MDYFHCGNAPKFALYSFVFACVYVCEHWFVCLRIKAYNIIYYFICMMDGS